MGSSALSACASAIAWMFASQTEQDRKSRTMIGLFRENVWSYNLRFICLIKCFTLPEAREELDVAISTDRAEPYNRTAV